MHETKPLAHSSMPPQNNAASAKNKKPSASWAKPSKNSAHPNAPHASCGSIPCSELPYNSAISTPLHTSLNSLSNSLGASTTPAGPHKPTSISVSAPVCSTKPTPHAITSSTHKPSLNDNKTMSYASNLGYNSHSSPSLTDCSKKPIAVCKPSTPSSKHPNPTHPPPHPTPYAA